MNIERPLNALERKILAMPRPDIGALVQAPIAETPEPETASDQEITLRTVALVKDGKTDAEVFPHRIIKRLSKQQKMFHVKHHSQWFRIGRKDGVAHGRIRQSL